MTYTEAIRFLYSLRLFGLKLGLENAFKLASLAGNPQNQLRFIHVAGTNGKGSVCAMLESIYRTAGLKVGLFTSPHLVAFGERIQVNRRLISQADVVRLVDEVKGLLESAWSQPQAVAASLSLRSPPQPSLSLHDKQDTTERNLKVAATEAVSHPTFFEVVTVMALRYFAEQRCDLVIWETGMGGRLDATNIVTPLASVITNVQLDHQQWLGNTLAEIAAEKAGIIKPGMPVITATEAPAALEVIRQVARKNNAPLTIVRAGEPTPGPSVEGNRLAATPAVSLPSAGGVWGGLPANVALPLLGSHQRTNAALAVATVYALQNEIPVNDAALRKGLEQVEWPGRLQQVRRGAQLFLLDGAHNPAGVETLRSSLGKHFPGTRPALVLGILRDKDWAAICEILAPLADRIYLTPVPSDRTATPTELRLACERANPAAKIAACAKLADALEQAAGEPFVLVTGSLYLVGEALELMRLSPAPETDEKGLNEWSQDSRTVSSHKKIDRAAD